MIKNALQLGVVFCGVLFSTSATAERFLDYRLNNNANTSQGVVSSEFNRWGGGSEGSYDSSSYSGDSYAGGEAVAGGVVGSGCEAQCPAESPVGPCYCKYVRYTPCYYNTWRCVEEPKYYTKRCCRQVPQCYQVQRCRYVPQYYSETLTKMVPEYYDVQECTTQKRYVCDKNVKYVPQYFYKKVCPPAADPAPSCAPSCGASYAAPQGGCASGSCGQY